MIPTIDSQFKALIPPLSAEERDQLEHNIMESRIAFGVREMEFCNRDDAMVWIIENQLGRRNIPDATRIELALQKSGILKEKAKQKQIRAGGDKTRGGAVVTKTSTSHGWSKAE